MTKEEYERLKPYQSIIDMFINTGAYVGGGDGLFDIMGVANRSCPTCLAEALINANERIKQYESNM